MKKWWFWVIAAVVVISIVAGGANSGENQTENASANSQTAEEIVYEEIDLQTMFDELGENAMKAEQKYDNKYIKITENIASFDSDGSYITVESTTKGTWDFDSIMCYVKNDEQKNFLLEKSIGDTVMISGKITDVGEFLGYSMNIDIVE